MGCMTQLYFFVFLSSLNVMCWHQRPMTTYVAIFKSLLHNVVMSPKVCSSLMLGSYLMAFSGAMAYPGCMPRLTFYDCKHHLPLFLWHPLCSGSPVQVPMSVSWKCSLWEASISLCRVSPSLFLMVSSSPTSSTLAPQRAGPKPSARAVHTSLLFLASLDRGIYVSQTTFCCICGWRENLFCLLYQYDSHDEPINQ